MGGEFGQWNEWDCKQEIHWDLLSMPYHQKLHTFVKELYHFYLQHPAFFERDFLKTGWEWVDYSAQTHLTLSYLRKGDNETLLCIHHFSPEQLDCYFIPFTATQKIKEIFSTDYTEFGGFGTKNLDVDIKEDGIVLNLPPLSTLILSAK